VSRRRPFWLVAAAAATVLALLGTDVARALDTGVADAGLAFFAPSACIGVAAALAVGRWPERRRMALLILLWLLVGVLDDLDWDWQASRTAATVSMLAFGLQAPVYAQMVLAYPAGIVRDRLERGFLAVAYPLSVAWVGFPLLFGDPRTCTGNCLPRVPSLVFTGHTLDLRTVGRVFDALFILLGAAVVGLVVRRLRRDPHGARRTRLPLMVAGVYAAAEFVAARVAELAGWSQAAAPLGWIERANTLLIPAAIFAGVATIRRQRGPVGDLVVELGAARPGEVRAALARTLGDPTLELGLWLPERHAFVDESGAALDAPAASPGRAATLIGPEREPLAVLVHAETLLGQRPLLEAAGSAGRLALENTRLQAQLRAQLAELRASRLRIVAAADSERRRLERDLHDGAQQRLLALGLALQLLRDNQGDPRLLEQAEAELQEALRELRDLARGIHPAILTERGLAAAVRSLVDRVSVAVEADLPEERYAQPVETAAFFVVSEALANVGKHATATSARISVGRLNGRLVVEVRDDGGGGAAATPGGGLQGLADRVGALEGRLTIDSPPGAGTTVRAEIPCASS
jgi:signal transduction histidine kinase